MRRLLVSGLFLMLLLGLAAPAWAQAGQDPEPFVVLSCRADVPEGEQVGDLVVGLALVWLAGRGADRILEAGRTRVGPSIGLGLLLFFGLPVLAVLALVPILGGLVWFAAVVFGLGALAVAVWRARAASQVAQPGRV